jgi:hypothetical protein
MCIGELARKDRARPAARNTHRALPSLLAVVVLARVHLDTPHGADAYQLAPLARRLPGMLIATCRSRSSSISQLRGSLRGNLPFDVLQNTKHGQNMWSVELQAQLWASFVAEAVHVQGRPEVFHWHGLILTHPTISEDGLVSILDANTQELVFRAELSSSDISQVWLIF